MDGKAVSPLIGFVLLLAIIMGFIGIVQSSWVPEWNRAVEAEHLDEVSYEVAKLSEAVSLAASTGNPAKVVIDAGVKYPVYYILISPSKAAGSISKKELWVNISGIVDSASYIKNFTTYAIVYRPNYFYSSSPELVFEHSAVFKIENSYLTVNSEQSSFTSNKITIYLINATFSSFSTTENINLAFYPVSYGGSSRFSGTISFTCYDERTASWWNETLSSIYGRENVNQTGTNINLTVNGVELSINYFVATATSAGEVEVVSETTPYRLLNLSNLSHNVYKGTTIPLGVRVVDEFSNPVRNVAVSVTDTCHGTATKNTNDNGEVWYYFNADNTGRCDVTFSVSGKPLKYTITVSSVSGGGGGGIFEVFWNVSSYDWNVSLVGPEKSFKVSVLYDTRPVNGAVVDISTDASSLVSYPESVTTDQNGESIVTVKALDNGIAHLFATAGGAGDVLELRISGVSGFCPADWSYWREITITNPGGDLTDYQIRIELDNSNFDFSHAKSDGSDIRFYDSGVTPLSYWIEEWDDNHAVIWVKVPSIPSGSKKIYMFYGNPSAESESDGESTFDFFDDFETFDTSKWKAHSISYSVSKSILTIRYGGIERTEPFSSKFQDGYIAETKVKFLNTGGWFSYSGVIPEVASSPYTASGNRNKDATILYMREYHQTGVYYWIGDGKGRDYDYYGYTWNSKNNKWYVTGVSVLNGEVKFWKDYQVVKTVSRIKWKKDLKYIKLGSFNRDSYYDIQDTGYDWVRVRKYADPEPSVNIGNENNC